MNVDFFILLLSPAMFIRTLDLDQFLGSRSASPSAALGHGVEHREDLDETLAQRGARSAESTSVLSPRTFGTSGTAALPALANVGEPTPGLKPSRALRAASPPAVASGDAAPWSWGRDRSSSVQSREQLVRAIPALLRADELGLDLETTGLDPLVDRICLLQLATPELVVLVDVDAVPDWVDVLAPVFAAGRFIEYNSFSFDWVLLARAGVTVPTGDRLFDCMIASQLLTASDKRDPKGTHTLGAVALRHLNRVIDKTEQVSDWRRPWTDAQVRYAATDVAVPLPLAQALRNALHEAGLDRTTGIEMRFGPVLPWLTGGIGAERAVWLALVEQAEQDAQRTRELLDSVSGDARVDWDSATQVAKLLTARGKERGYELPVRVSPHGKTSAVTDDKALATIEPLDPESVGALRGYRDATKITSTYGRQWLHDHVDADGHVRAKFWQLGARTGRMSCEAPNLQNIPKRTHRVAVVPDQGKVFVRGDYATIEMRIAAEVAPDKKLIEDFSAGVDIHTENATIVFGQAASKEEATTNRDLAKTIGFAVLYGGSHKRICEQAPNVSEQEAAHMRHTFLWVAHPGLGAWHVRQGNASDAPDGTLTTRTLTGRRCLAVSTYTKKLNYPVQGTGADLVKLAAAKLWESRDTEPSARLVAIVHDELLLEVDDDRAESAKEWLQRCMEEAGAEILQRVPVVAEVEVRKTWAEEKKSVHQPADSDEEAGGA